MKPSTIKIFIAVVLIMALAPGILTAAQTDEAPVVRLQYASFDPLAGGEPFIPAGLSAPLEAEAEGLYLVQFNGPVQESWKAEAEAAGARLYGYIPDYAFVARLDAAALEKVNALSQVRWVGRYHPAYRLSASLGEMLPEGESLAESSLPLELLVQTAADADPGALSKRVAALEGEVFSAASGYLRAVMPAANLLQLAASADVLWIEPFFEVEYTNDKGGTETMHAGAVQTLGYTGAGQIVAIADSGLDTGNESNLHPDFGSRLVKAYCLGRPSPCDWSDYVAHGTHVSGSVLGSGVTSGGLYAGTAPGAGLVMQALADAEGGLGGIPLDEGDLMRDAYVDGARIHTNSWGGPSGSVLNRYGGYVISSQQIDRAMWEHKDMLVLFSAGNNGADVNKDGVVDPDSIGQPGTAKNVLTVGASENNRPTINSYWGTSYGAPISSDKRADNVDGLAAFSSRGPTDDGRIKPDVVAPGTFIASTRTRQYLFNDNLEGATGGYTPNHTVGGGAGSWTLMSGDAHSASHYWQETVSGGAADAITFLLTPPVNVLPAGAYFDVNFWHKYSLSPGDQLIVRMFDANNLANYVGYVLGESGSSGSYALRTLTYTPYDFIVTPSAVRIGFGIRRNGSSTSTWQVDDIRLDGSDWGTLSGVGLTSAGSTVDENYLLMGGTSMSTPLTAGGAAVVRQWLTSRGFANPSAALVKAALVNGAEDMSPGQYTTSPPEVPAQRPNNATGWGRVNLLESIAPAWPRQTWLQDDTTGLNTGGTISYTFTITAPGTALSASQPVAAPQPDGGLPAAPETSGATVLPATFDSAPLAPEGVSQLLANTGFELNDASWATHNTARTTSQAYAGSYSMGSTPAVNGWFYQTVSFPTDAITATLNFKFKNDPPDAVGSTCYDYARMVIWDETATNKIAESTPICSDTTSWYSVDVSLDAIINNLKGRTVLMSFYTFQDDIADHAVFYFDEMYLYVGTGQPTTAGEDVRLTLAWSDYPGEVSAAKALVNDLDLEVVAPGGAHYYGNDGAYSGGQCLRGGLWDACNNLEGVVIPNAPYGTYTVYVHAYNVPQGPQPFALVAAGENILGTAPNLNVHIYLPMLTR